jgi:hypothetical protein
MKKLYKISADPMARINAPGTYLVNAKNFDDALKAVRNTGMNACAGQCYDIKWDGAIPADKIIMEG